MFHPGQNSWISAVGLLVIRWADLFPLADGTDGEESDRKWQDLLFPFSLLSGNIGGADAPAGGRYRRVQ